MKKILGSLMAVTLMTSVSSTVVACARGPKMHQIRTKFNEKSIGGVNYSEAELWTAFNGSSSTLYGASAPLKTLSRHVLNLLGFNQTLVTQSKRIPHFREFYMGNDQIENVDIYSAPSVDGTFYGEDVINMKQGVFYNQYIKTQINSIAGLYALYQYNNQNPGSVIAPGAQDSLTTIQNSYINDSIATQQFINSFLDLEDKNYDSAWVSQKYDFGEGAELSKLQLDSWVTPFDETTTTKDDKTTNKLTFSGEKNLGIPVDFPELNTSVERTPDAKIGSNKSEPFNLLLLPPINDGDIRDSSLQARFDTNWTYDKDAADGTKVWDMRQSSDAQGWKFTATDQTISDEGADKTEIGFIKTNESVVVPLLPLKLQYEYSTNIRDSAANKFIVNLTIEGVNAIFNPVRYQTGFKDPDKDSQNLGNRFIKWQFSHYQFNDINNVFSVPGNKKLKEAGNGYFSGLRITNMTVQNA